MLSLMLMAFSAISAIDVKDIPTPRPSGWVVDQTGQVNADTIRQLNQISDEVHQRDGAEIAVVVIPTTEGRTPRQFATELFNHWKIGDKSQNNGLLIFVSVNDRKAEIILGNGVDDQSQSAAAQLIMDSEIVPRFKQGDVAGALVAGMQQCVSRILHADIQRVTAPPAEVRNNFDMPNNMQNFDQPEQDPWPLIKGIGGMTTAGIGGYGVRRFLRYRKRSCGKCQGPMILLPETLDDKHLNESQQIEERIGSVDYDVWFCRLCTDVMTLRYAALFTAFSKCPQCRSRTRKKAETTLRASSSYSEGLVEVNESCMNCNYRTTYTRRIPRDSDSSSISSSGSSSSGFSGGSSSGSGASGSW